MKTGEKRDSTFTVDLTNKVQHKIYLSVLNGPVWVLKMIVLIYK